MSRPREQIAMDIRYAIRLNELHRRLFRRLKFLTALISLLAGSVALSAITAPAAGLTAAMAVLVAACGFADLLGQWSDHAARRSEYIRAYQALLTSQLTCDQMEDGLSKVYAMVTDDDIEALRAVAHNDNCRSTGWTHNLAAETVSQRLWRLVA